MNNEQKILQELGEINGKFGGYEEIKKKISHLEKLFESHISYKKAEEKGQEKIDDKEEKRIDKMEAEIKSKVSYQTFILILAVSDFLLLLLGFIYAITKTK